MVEVPVTLLQIAVAPGIMFCPGLVVSRQSSSPSLGDEGPGSRSAVAPPTSSGICEVASMHVCSRGGRFCSPSSSTRDPDPHRMG